MTMDAENRAHTEFNHQHSIALFLPLGKGDYACQIVVVEGDLLLDKPIPLEFEQDAARESYVPWRSTLQRVRAILCRS